MLEKLNVGIVTTSCLLRTGFSNDARILIPYLWKTQKYNIFQLNLGLGDDPNLMRFPWKNEGVFRPGTFDVGRMNSSDEGYKRAVSYGNTAIESFILRNKIDVLILKEDGWAFDPNFYFKSKWWPYLKANCLLHTTVDSIPILPLYKEWAENCPNVWFWTSFGVKALHSENKEKYGHVDFVHGCFDKNSYNILPKNIVLEYRRKFGIDDDTKVFLNLNRNQLRKLFPHCLESFAMFKKRYPEYKAKLHFHCSWSEGGGWPLDRLRTEFGISKEDVLCTYFCKNCKFWNIQPYENEDIDCPACKTQKSRITAGVTSTITNEEINLIYNIADANLSVITSGGLELSNVQGLLAGKSLLASNYSCNEDFCGQETQDFVFPLDGYFTYEVGTGFKKHVPNINTIAKFYKKICETPQNKLNEISTRAREWAIKNFDIGIIGPKFENWIDSRQKITWNYEYPPTPLKNPSAQIDFSLENGPFIKQLYLKILNVEVKDDDDGYKSWIQRLEAGQSREEIKNYFTSVAHKDNNEIINSQPQNIENLFDKTGRKTLLIVMKESIGDCIYLKCLLPSFKTMYNDCDIYVATSRDNFEIFEDDENIYKLLEYQPFMDSEITMTGQGENKGYVDYFCCAPVLTQKFLSYLTNDRLALKLS